MVEAAYIVHLGMSLVGEKMEDRDSDVYIVLNWFVVGEYWRNEDRVLPRTSFLPDWGFCMI